MPAARAISYIGTSADVAKSSLAAQRIASRLRCASLRRGVVSELSTRQRYIQMDSVVRLCYVLDRSGQNCPVVISSDLGGMRNAQRNEPPVVGPRPDRRRTTDARARRDRGEHRPPVGPG